MKRAKGRTAIVAGFVLLAVGSGFAEAGAGAVALSIDEFRAEEGVTWATVSVQNQASFELVRVTVECTARGQGASGEGTTSRATLASPGRPLAAGAATSGRLRVAPNANVHALSCSVLAF